MAALNPFLALPAEAATACTVTGPVSPTYRDAWASAYRCNKTSTGLGDSLGVYGDWYGYASEISSPCNGVTCEDVKLDFSLTAQLFDQYAAEGDDQLGAIARPDDVYGTGTFGAYWYYRRPSEGVQTRLAQYDCSGNYLGGRNDFFVGSSTPYWRMIVRRENSSENSNTSNPTWRIFFSSIDPATGALTCRMRVTNIGGMGYRSAEQWINNDHGSLPGSTRHRVRVSQISYLDFGSVWRGWPEGQTGNSYGGYASSGKVASNHHCLRTGDLGPTCP